MECLCLTSGTFLYLCSSWESLGFHCFPLCCMVMICFPSLLLILNSEANLSLVSQRPFTDFSLPFTSFKKHSLSFPSVITQTLWSEHKRSSTPTQFNGNGHSGSAVFRSFCVFSPSLNQQAILRGDVLLANNKKIKNK